MSLLTRWLESLADTITINDKCLRSISPFSKCEKCIDGCPEQALIYRDGSVQLIAEQCTACGKCMTICPVNAVEGHVPKREVIEHSLLYDKQAKAPSLEEWLYYASKGVRHVYTSTRELSEEWQAELNGANRVLEKLQEELILLTDDLPKAPEQEYSRRELLQLFGKESKAYALSSFTPAKWRFNHTAFSINKAFPEWSFYQPEFIEADCTLCEVCLKLCPKAVFKKDLEQGKLLIHTDRCDGCSLCHDACQEGGIVVHQEIKEKETVELPISEAICPDCKQPYLNWGKEAPEEISCSICQKRQENKASFFD